MKKSNNTHLAAAIEQAGSPAQVAVDMGVTESAVRNWVRLGRVPKTVALLMGVKYKLSIRSYKGVQAAPGGKR
jgi:transposase-like protein